jgi:hypothetical protein
MCPSEFEFVIHLAGEKISQKDTAFRKAISVREWLALTLGFGKFYDTSLSPLHFTITKTLNKPHNTTDLHHSSRRKHQEWKFGRGADGGDVARCTSRLAQAVTVSSL